MKENNYFILNIIFHAILFILNGQGKISNECKSNSVLSSHLPSAFVYDKEPGGSVGCGWGLRSFLPRFFVDIIAGLLTGISFYHAVIKKSKKYSYFISVLVACTSVLACWITLRDFSAVVSSYKWCALDNLKNLNFQRAPSEINCKYGSFFVTCTIDIFLVVCTVVLPISTIRHARTFTTTKRTNGSTYAYEKFTSAEDDDDDDDEIVDYNSVDDIDVKFKGSEKKDKKLLMTGYDIEEEDEDDNESGIVDFSEQSKRRFPPGNASKSATNMDKPKVNFSGDSSDVDFVNINKWTRKTENNTNNTNKNDNDNSDDDDFDFESFSNN